MHAARGTNHTYEKKTSMSIWNFKYLARLTLYPRILHGTGGTAKPSRVWITRLDYLSSRVASKAPSNGIMTIVLQGTKGASLCTAKAIHGSKTQALKHLRNNCRSLYRWKHSFSSSLQAGPTSTNQPAVYSKGLAPVQL